MATKDNDTDPSTPTARRPLSARPGAITQPDPDAPARPGPVWPASSDRATFEGARRPAVEAFPGELGPADRVLPRDPENATGHEQGSLLGLAVGFPADEAEAVRRLSLPAGPSVAEAARRLSAPVPDLEGGPTPGIPTPPGPRYGASAGPFPSPGPAGVVPRASDLRDPKGAAGGAASDPARTSGSPSSRTFTQTDPGVGPQAPVRSLPPQALGVVVPPPSPGAAVETLAFPDTPSLRKDSVELLLDGMEEPRDRTKTMPRTSGEGAAVYHAEHNVHAGANPPEPEPKVLVERPPTPRAIPAVAYAARVTDVTTPMRIDRTVTVPRKGMGAQLVLAISAGMLIVVFLFFAFQRMALGPGPSFSTTVGAAEPASRPEAVPLDRSGAANAPAAPSLAPTAANPSAQGPSPLLGAAPATALAAPAASPAEPPPSPTAEGAPTTESARAAGDVPSASADRASSSPVNTLRMTNGPTLIHKRRLRQWPPPPAPSSKPDDVGEFKTTF